MSKFFTVGVLVCAVLLMVTQSAEARRSWSGNYHRAPEPKSAPAPKPSSAPSAPVVAGEKVYSAYITGYGYPDNDPANSDTTWHSGKGGHAGGMGTFSDPITLAVGESNFPYGMKFYVPNVRAYFAVKDTCAACGSGKSGKSWIDMWVGGQGAPKDAVIRCEESLTGVHKVIENPASNYIVIAGSLYQNGQCRSNFGDSVLLK